MTEQDRVTRLADELFVGLAHGDEGHRRWLREEMEKCLRNALAKQGGRIVWDEDYG